MYPCRSWCSEYKKLKAKMKRLQKIKRDMQHPGQALKHKLQPDAYKQAKHKVHQAKNPGQTLKHKLQPDAYKKAKRRLKKISKLKKMMKGEVSAIFRCTDPSAINSASNGQSNLCCACSSSASLLFQG